ncbi:glycosyltransferase [Halobacillus amylolyticus]|uniref:Glycosyltransferase n=1 Tax=Halobacillus amylolyticus TaxID=2932259 RepID=A0ABY4HFX3_9BACI|nr:glycosyltransferase [Halobacillus amylolyticus]UOR13793.1 glycosyltransferase [Halobacillus amylolyticus]
MKNVLITSFDMEVGGVERSLISMLDHFDYINHQVDLMLCSHTGDFMKLLPKQPTLLKESSPYKTFRMSISQIFKKGNFPIGIGRLLAKYRASHSHSLENGYKQMQYMWKYTLPFLPKIEKKYDVAISYLWPHYLVAEKVEADTKIAWIHTDYSTVETDIEMDLALWNKFDSIIAVSEECKKAFIRKYPPLLRKVSVVENITSPDLIKSLADEDVENPMTNDSRFKLLTVSRLSHAKGIDQAVEALKILKDKGYQDIAWYVVGYGGDETKIKKLISEYGLENEFILLGKKINPYPFMKAADLYVQPSRYEGKAVTVGEAQVLAKPVLITNYPTAPSQITDGIDGIICDLSIKGIADGIVELYTDSTLRSQLAYNCSLSNYHNHHELKKLYQLV